MAGEIVLLPRNDAHVLASAHGVPPVSARELLRTLRRRRPSRDPLWRRRRRDACGLRLSRHRGEHNPLFATLPSILRLDIAQGASREWVEASVRFAGNELVAGRLSSPNVMARLAELLLVEAVRHYSSSRPPEEAGWLKGLRDPQIGRALALIHQDMAKPWSAESLAQEVALSRSTFVDRFTALVGTPPIRYLTLWRLQSAKLALRETSKSVAQTAHAVGYESEEAFSRAFKREFGVPPARWRDQHTPKLTSAPSSADGLTNVTAKDGKSRRMPGGFAHFGA